MQRGFMLLDGQGPGYVGRIDGGRYVCHWSFLPRLYRDMNGALEIPSGVRREIAQLNELRRTVVASKLSDSPGELRDLFGTEAPYAYQWAGINFIRAAKGVLLADDVGLGKTIQTVGATLAGFQNGEITRAIVLCPSSVKYQWRDEFLRFASAESFPDLAPSIVVVHGDAATRAAQYARPHWSVLIMTYGVFLRDVKRLLEIGDVECLVLDEANAIKTRTTKTAKAVKHFAVAARSTYRIALTATPLENRLHDLYSICELLDVTLFPSARWFEQEYCKTIPLTIVRGKRRIVIQQVVGHKHLDDARRRMEPVYLRRTFREVGAQLPEVVSTTLRLELTKQQRAMYDEVALAIHKANHGDKVAVIGQLVKLREICDSTGLISGPHHSAKMDELSRIMDELPEDAQLVVFSEFRKMTDHIVSTLRAFAPLYIHGGTEDVQRQVIRKQFTEGMNRLLVMTSAGERGLNLQCAGLLVNIDLPYNPARLKQRIGRLWRLGSKHSHVRVLNMVAEDTFEQRVLDVLNKKERLFDVLFQPDGVDRIGDPVSSMSASQLRRMI